MIFHNLCVFIIRRYRLICSSQFGLTLFVKLVSYLYGFKRMIRAEHVDVHIENALPEPCSLIVSGVFVDPDAYKLFFVVKPPHDLWCRGRCLNVTTT